MASQKGGIGQTFTTFITTLVLVATAIAGAYVWGVMRGRKSQAPRPPVAEAKRPAPAPVPQPEAILKAQELEFAQILRGEKKPTLPEPVQAPPPEAPKEVEKTAPPVEDAETGPPATDSQTLHDYIFQIAALKDEQAVDALRQKLEGRGLRTRMERSGKLFLVLVLLRGDEARSQEIFQAARELRLGPPLLRSKKPANP